MGIFDGHYHKVFTTYRATLEFRDRIMGGTPKDPKIIESWLRAKAGISDDKEINEALRRTLVELGVDVGPNMTMADLEKASEALAAHRQTNGFKIDENGLYIEGRTVKAMLKESVNVLFAGSRWGITKKGPRSFFAERVFVNPDHISLGVREPSGVDLFIGHVNGPQGAQSTLAYYEYVTRARISFDIIVLHDEIKADHWPSIWLHAQENGLGSLRSQGFGRFDITAFDNITGKAADDVATRILASVGQ